MIFIMLQAIENEEERNRLAVFYTKYRQLLRKKSCEILETYHMENRFDLANDMLQDAMAKMIQNIGTVSKLTDYQMIAYAVQTIRSCTIDFCRKSNSYQKAIQQKGILEEAENREFYQNPIEQFTHDDPIAYLGQILATLPQKDRDILIYKYFLKYDDSKIADLLDIKVDSVRMAMTRARRKIREEWRMVEEGL